MEPATDRGCRWNRILALGDVELGMANPVADSAFIAKRDGGNMIEGMFFGDMPAGLADHQHEFAFIIELLRRARPDQRRIVTDERARRAHEHAGKFRRVLAVFVFGIAVRIVHADADDLFRRGNGRAQNGVVEGTIGGAFLRDLAKARQGICCDDLTECRIVF